MVFLKLTVLSLLIAAPGLLVSGENMITCYGDVQHLHCDTGMIKVKSSVYGCTNSTICSVHRPHYQVPATRCSLGISDRCNGQRDCEVKTDSLVISGPCYGLHKYYNTTYICIKGRLVVICEHGYSTLDCGDDKIYIINANFGRTDSITCSKGLPNHLTQNTNCYAPNTFSTVATRCNGNRRCTVEASYTIFSDHCVGTAKYLSVSYICTTFELNSNGATQSFRHSVGVTVYSDVMCKFNFKERELVTCEGYIASLKCGDLRIKIISANYGRTDATTCSSGRPDCQISNTKCYTPNTLNKVAARCEGHSSCDVPATNSFFSDPCPNTYKYLKIVYACV